jgi:UDP-N-acetylmuramoyl-tripeptide--D-alanyl-D-alanine ligase
MPSKRAAALGALVVVVAGLGGVVIGKRGRDAAQPQADGVDTKETSRRFNRGAPHDGGVCDPSRRVTKEELIRSVELGTAFLLAHQKPAGNFDYQYDWKSKAYANDDNDVRQAGALWGLALFSAYAGPPKTPPSVRAAVAKGLALFDGRAGDNDVGRYPVYPEGKGEEATAAGTGMAALVTLSIADYVRGLPEDAKTERERWTSSAKKYVDFLVKAREPDGLWFGSYHYDGGAPFGAHSSYSDGECLLALVTAMKVFSRDDLAPILRSAAEAGHRINIERAQAKERDSDVTKGYYQWSSMAFYELATSPLGKDAPYGDWLMGLADWILDVHHVLDRPKNTGYAFEGLVSAYAWAKSVHDPRASKYECAIHNGLATLLSEQVGHPRAADLGATDDPKALGGVQNGLAEPALRIDVTQHQMHATILAIQHLF